MGIVMGFTRVTPEELDRAMQDPEWAEELLQARAETDLDVYIDKSWDDIQKLLDAEDIPVELYTHLEYFDEDCSRSAWHADDVREAAGYLRGTPFARLARHLDPGTDQNEVDYLRFHYENLVRFFDAAAAAGAAAIMGLG